MREETMTSRRVPRLAVAAVVGGLAVPLGGCVAQPTATAVGEPRTVDAWTETISGSAPAPDSCELQEKDHQLLPDAECSPGAVTKEISPSNTAPVCRDIVIEPIAESARDAVLTGYGIDAVDRGNFTVEYLVPPRLGGANDFANLWPIPLDHVSRTSKAHTDSIVIDAVCGKRAGIQAAQYTLANDWTTALARLRLD